MKNTFYRYNIVALLCCLLMPGLSYAQNEGRWYQVEVLIFKNTNYTNSDDISVNEMWREDIRLNYPDNTQYLNKLLPKSAHNLGGHNYTLRKSGQYKVLFHQAWNQQMWGKNQAPNLVVRGGTSYGDYRELEGSIRIHIGRYLHVTTDLWLSQFYTANSSEQATTGAKLPALPGKASNDRSAGQPSRIVTVREKRRMRSKETHYIDHPLVGILVRMVPIKTASN